MITDKKEALEGLENGEKTLADISPELRSDEEIAIAAIKEYGESAITFLTATNSLPHTPEVFLTILLDNSKELSEKLKADYQNTVETIKNADYNSDKEIDVIDDLMSENSKLSGDLKFMNLAIDELTKYIEKQNIPIKGGQEH